MNIQTFAIRDGVLAPQMGLSSDDIEVPVERFVRKSLTDLRGGNTVGLNADGGFAFLSLADPEAPAADYPAGRFFCIGEEPDQRSLYGLVVPREDDATEEDQTAIERVLRMTLSPVDEDPGDAPYHDYAPEFLVHQALEDIWENRPCLVLAERGSATTPESDALITKIGKHIAISLYLDATVN